LEKRIINDFHPSGDDLFNYCFKAKRKREKANELEGGSVVLAAKRDIEFPKEPAQNKTAN